MAKPIAIDLFSGAGGLSEGFRQAGVIVAASVELDPHAVKTQHRNHVYRKHNRTDVVNGDVCSVPIQRFISAVKRYNQEVPHIIMGGPPCQGFSRSNMNTRDLRNPLNSLYQDFLTIVDALRPPVVIMENVADLLTFQQGCVERAILDWLRNIGYQVEREVLNAVDYSVPQKRKRVFFLASLLGHAPDFPEPTVKPTNYTTVWQAISDLPSLTNGHSVDEMAYAAAEPLSEYQKMLRHGSKAVVCNNLVSRNNDLVIQRYRHIPQGGNWRSIPDELMTNYADKNRCHEWIYRRLSEDEPSITITNFRKNMLIHPREDRGLSVREAARLQSFPDCFVFCGSIGFQQQQVADAVPPLLAKAVAYSVREHLGL